jgi:hypothetical protein
MSILFYVFLGIAIDVAIIVVLKMMMGERQKMSYGDYLHKYGSVADSNPGSYSNHKNYM